MMNNEIKKDDKTKCRKWAEALQRWSDRKLKNKTTPQGKCGYMAICDNCVINDFPCYFAYVDYCREHNIEIDFNDFNFGKNKLL